MRTGEKYFEQVPIEVVEKILSEAAEAEEKVGRGPAADLLPERGVPSEPVEEKGGAPSKNDR